MQRTDLSFAGFAATRVGLARIHNFLQVVFIMLVAVPTFGQTSVLTQHNDNARTGQNTSETILTTANVNTSQFGKLFTLPVDGQVYAQPLYVPGVTINGGVHNVVIIATENDSVYAYDADSSSAALLWKTKASLVDAAHGAGANETALETATTTGCSDMQPQVGITSTPVIDPTSKTIYVEAKSTNGTNYFHRLHALDLLTGNEKTPGPVVITATVSGTGDGSLNGQISFDNLHQLNRPGLLLLNSTIYIGYASHCDGGPYHGWLFAYDAATFTQKSVYMTTPNGGLGGFWMTGDGVAADASGNIFIPSGNGTFDNTQVPVETGDTILKLGTANQILTLLDYFTPEEQLSLENTDTDLGSGGVLLLPDQPGSFPHILVQAGKEGRIYVVNRDQMTTNNSHYCSGCPNDPEIIEESGIPAVGAGGFGMFNSPVYWNNTLYFWGVTDVMKSIPITNGLPDFTHVTRGSIGTDFPGAGISVSSNGTTAGSAIVWAIDSSQYGSPGPGPGPAILYAFDATNIPTVLYSSAQNAARDAAGNAVKFTVPTVANGKVYVGTSTEVDAYGLLGAALPTAATPVINPASETVTSPIQVTITDSTSGAGIYYTTDGSTPSPTHGTLYSSGFTLTSSATVKAIAAATNFQNSVVASTSYTINSVPIAATPLITPAFESVSSPIVVTITDSTSGAIIYYTTDNSTPSPTHGTQYTSPFTLTSSTIVQAMAAAANFQNSSVATATYTIGSASALQFETESPTVFNASVSSGPTYRVFSWGGFTNGAGTTLDGTAAGQFVTITLNVPQAGVYDVKVATKKYTTRGIVQLSIQGSNVGPAEDQYSASEAWQELDLGNVTLAAGNQQFKFTTTGKNPSSSGFTQAYDYIKLIPISSASPKLTVQFEPEAPPVFNASVSSGPTYRVFNWDGFTDDTGTTLDATAAGQFVTITLSIPQAGVYDVKVATKKYTTRGIVQLSIQGSNVGPAEDQYSASEAWQELDLGNVTLAAGNQQFKFTTTGKNSSSSGFTQAYDYIKLTSQ